MQGFEGIGPNGLTPPDPDIACGIDHMVAVTNDDFATYDRCGNELFRADIHDFLGITTADLLSDPKVVYDPWDNRWVMMYHRRNTANETTSLVLVITSGSTPFGLSASGSYWYDFNALQNGGTSDAAFADYFDLGYSNDFVTTGGNMFRFSGGFPWGRVWAWDKDQIYMASTAGSVRFSNLTNGDGTATDTPRTSQMQVSWSEGGFNFDGSYLNSRGGGGDTVTAATTAFAGATVSVGSSTGVTTTTKSPLPAGPPRSGCMASSARTTAGAPTWARRAFMTKACSRR